MKNEKQCQYLDFLPDDDFNSIEIDDTWRYYEDRAKFDVCKFCGMDIYSERNALVIKTTNDIIHEYCYLDYCEENKPMLTEKTEEDTYGF